MEAVSVLKADVQAVRDASAELRTRLRGGETLRVEDLLERYPALAASDEAVLELIHTEIATRSELGRRPTLNEWRERFPRLIPRMDRILSQHSAFGTEMPTLSDASASALDDGRPASEPTESRLPRIGSYQILQEIGRGGMGVVYKARQANLSRIVVIKMILAGEHASLKERARLRIEAEAAAQLLHPNVVQVFEIGEHDGLPFLAMEYVSGGNLMRMLRGKPQAFRWSARLIETLARAIHEAHKRGIIHRDLNPSNILVSHDGTPKISDFGLAKFLVDGHGVSANGVILGTPSYMAPEQISDNGAQVGPATDVYALGALLYEMTTGTAPFRGFTPMETLCQVMEAELVPPSRLRHGVPEDLETICLKCLDRDPTRRYETAEDLADDLRRYCESQPIRARRTSRLRRIMQWRRRQPLAANLLALSVLLFLMVLGIAAAYGVIITQRKEELQKQHEDEQREISLRDFENHRLKAEARRAFQQTYDLNLSQIKQSLDAGEVELAQDLFDKLESGLQPGESGGFEWRYLKNLLARASRSLSTGSAKVQCLAISPGSETLISGDATGEVVIWNLARGTSARLEGRHDDPVRKVAIDADASSRPRAYASLSEKPDHSLTLKVWEAERGTVLSTVETGPLPGKVSWQSSTLRFSPRGESLSLYAAAADSSWTEGLIWKREGGTWRVDADQADKRMVRRAISDDGALLAKGARDGTVTLHGLRGQTPVELERTSGGAVLGLVFSHDGKHLAASRDDRSLSVWDVTTGKLLPHMADLEEPAVFLAFCLDDAALVGSDGKREVWTQRIKGPGVRRILPAPDNPLTTLKLSADRRRLAGGGSDHPVTLWNLERGLRERSYTPSSRFVKDFVFGADGQSLILCCDDQHVRIWNFWEDSEAGARIQGHRGEAWTLAFSPDGKMLASGGDDHVIRLWDLDSQKELGALSGHDQTVTSLAFFEGGRRLASVGLDGRLIIWNLSQGSTSEGRVRAESRRIYEHSGQSKDRLRAVTVSPDGQRLAVAGSRGVIEILDLRRMEVQSTLEGPHNQVEALLYSPNPWVLVSALSDGALRFWEARGDSHNILETRQAGIRTRALAFSVDGLALAYAGDDGTVRLFSMNSWTEEDKKLFIHPLRVRSVAFCPDQRTVATGCDDKKVRLWDLATGQLFYALTGHSARINAVAFSPDGRILASCDHDGVIRLWRAGSAGGTAWVGWRTQARRPGSPAGMRSRSG